MSYLGSWKVDDLLTFYANTTRFDTGAATDADSVPTYRVYEDETGTPLLTGSMALIDSSNTAGFYSEQITLSAANGFEKGKCYSIYITATVNSVAGATHKTFQMEAEVDANTVSTGVNTTSWGGTAVGSTEVRANLINIAGSAVSTSTAQLGVNVVNIGGSSTPTTNIGVVFNTDFATNYNTTIDMWNVNVENWNTTAVPAEHTAGYPIVTVKDGTGTGEINTNAGAIALVDLVTLTNTTTTLTNAPSDSSGVTTLLSRVPSGIFTGMTSLAQWLGLIAGKQTPNSTAQTEIRATGAGSGAYDATTDSQEAIRDRGDAAWITATGFSTHSAADVWSVATRSLTILDEDSTTLDLDATIRAAVGMASANFDTQVGDIPTNGELATAITTGLTTALTEGYRATNATGSVRDLLYEIIAHMGESSISSTTKTLKKLDGSTTAKTYTLNSATTPTSITEAT